MPRPDQFTEAGYKTLMAIGKACKASPTGVCEFYSLNRNGGNIGATKRLCDMGMAVKEVVGGFSQWRLTEKGIEIFNRRSES